MSKAPSRKPTKPQQRASSPGGSVWVSANAGSGKTQVLVDRVIKLLLNGAEPSTILCITFTKAAAAEMSLRLFRRLSSWTALDDQSLNAEIDELGMPTGKDMLVRARRLFTLALETPGGLKIQTIHGFCERLLQLFPIEAGLAPGFKVIEELEAEQIRDAAISSLLTDPNLSPDLEKAIEEAQARISNLGDFADLVVRFMKIIAKNKAFREGRLSRSVFETALKLLINLDPLVSAAEAEQEILTLDRNQYHAFAEALKPFGTFRSKDTPALLEVISTKLDCMEELRSVFLTAGLEPLKDMISKEASKACPEALAFLKAEQDLFHRRLKSFHALQSIEASGAIFEIANLVRRDIELRKQRSGLSDFDDLIEKTAALLTGNNATRWVLQKLDKGLNHILVDEAQDTSPQQWQIIRSLADEFFAGQGREHQSVRTMFVVGDQKQSIYSFQGADLATYNETRAYLTARLDQAGKRFGEEKLDVSFRSAQDVLDAVDSVFNGENLVEMGISTSGIEESPHSSARPGVKGIVELWPLVLGEKREKEEGEAWEAPVDQLPDTHHRRILARKIAATVKDWIGKRPLAGEDRLVSAGDILILLQSRTGLFPLLLAEMRRLGLPVAGADRLTLQKSLAVQDVMALIQWSLLPQDDYALACVLKSPLVPEPLTEEQLFAIAHGREQQSLWQVLSTQASFNAEFLGACHSMALASPVADFVHYVLNQSRKRIVGRLGSEALEATDALLDLAYDFESSQGGGLSAFLNWFEKSETTLKREMDQASDQIRVMSVHASKGLEANIVILPDATHVASGDQQNRLLRTDEASRYPSLPFWNLTGQSKNDAITAWIEAEKQLARQERNRLLYVAMTRARNELYITGSLGGRAVPEHSWWNRVETILGPTHMREPALVQSAADGQLVGDLEKMDSLPTWLLEPVRRELPLLNQMKGRTLALGQDATRRHGIALHRLMQVLIDADPDGRRALAVRRGPQLGLEPGDVEKLLALFDRPDLAAFWAADGRSEVEIWSPQATSESQIYRIDRLVQGPSETLVLDYKSGFTPVGALALDHAYRLQLASYFRVLKAAIPEKPVRSAILWLESGRLDWFSESELSRSLEQAASGLVMDAS